MLLISANSFNAQITLAGQTNDISSNGGLQMAHLSTGYNFVQQVDSTTPSMTNYSFIRIYDLNLNPVKNIALPLLNWPGYGQAMPSYSGSSILFVSDKLFNTDNSIEFIVKYSVCGGVGSDSIAWYLMNENGIILTTLVSKQVSCISTVTLRFEYYSDGSTFSKLLLRDGSNNSQIIYNLPGFLPCETCSMPTGFSSQGANSKDGMKVNVQPNPSSGDFTFQYTLPKDKQNGELTITDIGGSQVKTVNVTNQSGSVSVNMSDLSSGVYIFQLKSGTSQSSPQKIILAK
jgi:hypothetical protein